ncbi:hypothetical protein M9980_12715 [Sphingomonas donggukensis]|uniref:Uncharacterized protein n=1 Tax=Sphingomonas donggukensis TaxID=2949093 RepID=A0ABY4TTV6_9SPHN|nr:hypothetical protein [Sphingomonas donggukensis]URW75384.1 hypothetical protein M9980_12715 [Sphingomonas donggukensis]
MIALALALLQAAAAGPAPQRWSVLAGPCPVGRDGEIVVCAPEMLQRLPLPEEREPPARPRQPAGDPRAALDNAAPPCPPRGCMSGGINLLAIGKTLVDEIGYAAKRKHPGKREPIVLD